jgi:hypothetical protein
MKTKLLSTLAVALLAAGCAATPAPKAESIHPAGIEAARFHAVVIESVRIAPEAGMLNAANRQSLERELHYALVESIPSALRAATPGEGVLRVAVTVTELDAVSPAKNGLSTTLLGVPLDRGAIGFEARFYDATGTTPFAQTQQRRGAGRLAFRGSFSHYGHAVGALRGWGTELASSL